MSDARPLIAETVERLFADSISQDDIARAENGDWLAPVWNAIEEAGLTRVLVSPEAGGAGGDWLDAFEIARAVGRHCVPLPIVETILAAWLLERGGLEVPEGPLGLVPETVRAAGVARLERVPWGRNVIEGVGFRGVGDGSARLTRWRADELTTETGQSIALEPRDTLTASASTTAETSAVVLPPNTIRVYGALLRAGQMTGALERILDQSVQYANERIQFGRPIGNFQIIQQELARLAGMVAEVATAAEIAFRAAAEAPPDAKGELGVDGDPAFEIACAKVVAGEAAEHGPRIAHQAHGAIGFTYEHSLHFSTRRLWAWRTEFGRGEEWASAIGDLVQDAGGGEIWPLVTSR